MTSPIFYSTPSRAVVSLGAAIGGLGVVLAAGSTHGGDALFLGSASTICLAHAPVLVALGLFGLRTRLLTAAAILLVLGTLVFSADLIARHFLGSALFPMAAPIGGSAMILGWLVLVVAGLVAKG